ncbi:MAG: hypothetical protein DI536_25155 [Archangium gephyra]|uniref:Uncharacterized protein n=1 Tax=Archangium gephyra TaxID=48 RepID=A0A2W5SYZ0_9BACT|nr:MAG: hypothetical protein DI536_25155 [Archangium gephyra]
MDSSNRISLTPTVARQTPKNEFGNVLKDALTTAANVGGSLLGGAGIPGAGIVSAAVNNVTALASSGGNTRSASLAATGVTTVGGGGNVVASTGAAGGATQAAMNTSVGAGGDMTGMISQMRAEADRSMMVQMQMQNESREYNTLSNVLKVRHDSAKSAINNIR